MTAAIAVLGISCSLLVPLGDELTNQPESSPDSSLDGPTDGSTEAGIEDVTGEIVFESSVGSDGEAGADGDVALDVTDADSDSTSDQETEAGCVIEALPSSCAAGLDAIPRIVLPPLQQMPGDGGLTAPPSIAWGGDAFGVLAESFTTLTPAGTPIGAFSGVFIPDQKALGATHKYFGVYSISPANVGLSRLDHCGRQVDRLDVSVQYEPSRVSGVTGSTSEALLLTGVVSPSNTLNFSWVPDPSAQAPKPAALTAVGKLACCDKRQWVVGSHNGSTYVVWLGSDNFLYLVDLHEAIAALPVKLSGCVGDPHYLGSYQGELLLVAGKWVCRIKKDGSIHVAQLSEDAAPCRWASSGTKLKKVCLEEGLDRIRFTDFDPNTGKQQMQYELYVASALGPADIAWDGLGYGVVWYETGGAVAYSHVCEP